MNDDLSQRKEMVRQEINSFIQHLSKRHSTEGSEVTKVKKPRFNQRFWLLNRSEIKNLTHSKIQVKVDVSNLMPKVEPIPQARTPRTPRTPKASTKFRFAQNAQKLKEEFHGTRKVASQQIDTTNSTSKPSLVDNQCRTPRSNLNQSATNMTTSFNDQASHTPLYKRYQAELEKRSDKLEKIRQYKLEVEERQLQSLTFQPNQMLQREKDQYRSFDEFLKHQEDWSFHKEGHLQYLKDQNNMEIDQKCTYSPKITSKSQQIVDKRKNFMDFKSTEDRLNDFRAKKNNRIEAQRQQQLPPFKPTINKKSKQIVEEKLSKSRCEHIPQVFYPYNFIV